MARFTKGTPVRVAVEGSTDWVDIKPKLSRADREAFLRYLIQQSTMDGEMNNFAFFSTSANARTELYRLAVVDWRILDDEKKPVKYDPELLEFVDDDDPLWEAVSEEIAERNPTLLPSRSMPKDEPEKSGSTP